MSETPYDDRADDASDSGVCVEDSSGGENVFGTEGPATDYFIAEEYRKGQREAIEAIEDAFDTGYQYVVLDAPTGSGKSHIARAFAFQSGDAHIVTVQKLLQDQYQHDFPDMAIMKGRSAYPCKAFSGKAFPGLTCSDGPCRASKKYTPHLLCPYVQAKAAAIKAPVTVHNMDSFYYQNAFGRTFKGRKLLIIDEAHSIENKFGGFLSFTLSSKMGLSIPELQRIEEYDEFVEIVFKALLKELEALDEQYQNDSLSDKQMRRMDEVTNLASRVGEYLNNRKNDHPREYVFEFSQIRDFRKVQFRPVFIHDFARRRLLVYGQRVLMMSATILDKLQFCNDIGLDPDEVHYLPIPSYFPARNRPIIRRYVGSMTWEKIEDSLPKLVVEIERILDKYPNRKGIIQTHNERIATYIQSNIKNPRLTFNKDFPTPWAMLEEHKRKAGSFIVASGLREGLDLRGDLSKVQILCKVPYPNLSDKRVHRRKEIDPQWFGWVTALMFVQILGRSVRSETEKAVTFILDSAFGFFYKRNSRFIPGYVKEAIDWTKGGKV